MGADDAEAYARTELQRAAVTAAVVDVYRAGAVAESAGVGYDPAARDGQQWWAQAMVLTSERAVERVGVVGYPTAPAALAALAQAVTERVASPQVRLPDELRRPGDN